MIDFFHCKCKDNILYGKFFKRVLITITKDKINISNAFFSMKLNKYIFYILSQDIFFEYLDSVSTGAMYPVCKKQDILNFKIPLLTKSIQNKIVKECETIDKASEKAHLIIDKSNSEIYNYVKKLNNNNWEKSTFENLKIDILGNLSKIPKKEILEIGKYPVITQESNKLISGYTNESLVITDLPLIIFGDHTCIFKYIDFPFVRGADGTKLLKVDSKKVIPKYFYFVIKQSQITNKNKYERHYKYIKNLEIPVPPLSEQKILVYKLEKLENEIRDAKLIIESSSDKKQKIMDKYLK